MKFTIFILISIIFSFFNVFGQVYISEINFQEFEYVELYSDEILNLSNIYLFDEAIDKLNIFKQIKFVDDSNIILLVGENFIQFHNISDLNCSIYSNDKNELGFYGLRNTGENFTIFSNTSDFNLSFVQTQDYIFNLNETLNYNFYINYSVIFLQTPGFILKWQNNSNFSSSNEFLDTNISLNISIQNESNTFENITNSINSSLTQDLILQNYSQFYSFEIILDENISTDKLRYKFKTNATDYILEYWIEDFGGNILKDKKNTTSLSEKTFTPDKSEIMIIQANLYINSTYVLNISKIAYFYSKTNKIDLSTISSSSKLETEPYLKILNQNSIENLSDSFLEYEAYRGNSSKRTVYIYFNDKKLTSFELDKFTKVGGKVIFENILQNNSIVFSGFDLENKINFYPPEFNLLDNGSIVGNNVSKLDFFIDNFSYFGDFSINFSLNYDFNLNYDVSCYVYFDKTQVSDSLNILNQTYFNIYTLTLNKSKILEKSNKDKISLNETNVELKLSCRYKKSELKTYKYSYFYFNYSLNKNDNSNLIINSSLNEGDFNINTNTTESIYINESILTKTELYLSNKKNSSDISSSSKAILNPDISFENSSTPEYISKNEIMKENSYFTIFLATMILSIFLILFW